MGEQHTSSRWAGTIDMLQDGLTKVSGVRDITMSYRNYLLELISNVECLNGIVQHGRSSSNRHVDGRGGIS